MPFVYSPSTPFAAPPSKKLPAHTTSRPLPPPLPTPTRSYPKNSSPPPQTRSSTKRKLNKIKQFVATASDARHYLVSSHGRPFLLLSARTPTFIRPPMIMLLLSSSTTSDFTDTRH